LVSFFIVGLNDHLKYNLLLAQPVSYPSVVSIAKIYEQKQLYIQHLGRPPGNRNMGNSFEKTTINSTGLTRSQNSCQNSWVSNRSISPITK